MTAERSRSLRATEMFGWVGLVGSIILAIVVLWGHGLIAGRIDETFASVDDALGRGNTVVTLARGRLEERIADIDAFLADARSLAATSSVPADLADRAAGIADHFALIRDEYVAVRARVGAALETLQRLGRLMPGVEIGANATDALAALDERVAAFDASLGQLRADARTTVERATAALTTFRTGVDGFRGVTERITSGVEDVQARVQRANETIDSLLWIATIVLLLLLAYIAVLSVLVIRLARR